METFTSKISFIRRALGEIAVARDGVNVAASCPKCGSGSKKKKFSINVDNWNCHCWVCGVKGKDLYRILINHVSADLGREFKERFLGDTSMGEPSLTEEDPKVELPKGFIPLCLERESKDPDVRDCIRYLKGRGINLKDLWYFKVGSSTSGRFRRRIIIPSFDSEGELNYFSARTIDDKIFPKYVNSRAKKTEIIFNEINIDWKSELTIVEGPFDLFKCDQNSTCLLGSSLSRASFLFKKIVSHNTPVLLALDGDMQKKSLKIANLLSEYCCPVRILPLGRFSDVGEMSKEEFKQARENSALWTRERSIKEKIASIRTGSLF